MSRLILLIYFTLLISGEAMAEPLQASLRPTYEPGYISIVLSLIFVICLIYATGIIYNKLNHFGIKTLKAQNKDFCKDKITILSTTPLGPNKTLHVIELDGRKMLIGASANSIHLIKDFSNNESQEITEVTNSDLELQYSSENEINQEENLEEEFGLYKKYLR